MFVSWASPAGLSWEDWKPANAELIPGFNAWRRGELQAAEQLFSTFLNGRDADALRGYGSVLWTQGRFQQACDVFSEAVELEPWNPMHWGNLGLALRDLKKLEPALAALDTSIMIDPGYEPGWNEKANVLYDMHRFIEALDHYYAALAIFSGRAVVHHNIGMCHIALDNVATAAICFESALDIDPGYDYARQMLGRMSATFTT